MKHSDALAAARELQLLHGERLEVMFHGLSMDPMLFEGDQIIVESIDAAELRVGDIVTYRHLDRYPTRRVVAVDRRRLTLWCDAWPSLLFHAAPDDVLGRVVARVRNEHRLEADSPEWSGQRARALRRYRRYRLVHLVRRVRGRLRRER